MDLCLTDADCPTDYVCLPDGRCGCTSAACPAGTTCNTTTGECEAVGCTTDADCPTGWVCNPTTQACEPGGNQGDGAPCLSDSQCDEAAGLMCDNCAICEAFEPGFVPTYTCRFQCSLMAPQCPVDRECISRRIPFTGLCMPTTP
jgi:Cys-rich repeat protein